MLGHNLLPQVLGVIPSSLVENHHSRGYPGSPAIVVLHSTPPGVSNLGSHQSSKPVLTSNFFDKSLYVANRSCFQETIRLGRLELRAALATDPALTESTEKFDLDGHSQLQVNVVGAAGGSPAKVVFEVTNSSPSLILHWGAINYGKKTWVLPSHRPNGTQNYKHRALRTPFIKSRESSFLTIEVQDPNICAIEFILKDETRDKWFKYNGQNFRIELPRDGRSNLQIPIPEDLVQIQAYLRWERKGKQMYTPEQEKVELQYLLGHFSQKLIIRDWYQGIQTTTRVCNSSLIRSLHTCNHVVHGFKEHCAILQPLSSASSSKLNGIKYQYAFYSLTSHGLVSID